MHGLYWKPNEHRAAGPGINSGTQCKAKGGAALPAYPKL